MVFNIKDFGAKGNGTDKDTAAIQKALDKCFSNGGGTVVVPAGTFLTGTIWIKDNTNLNLQPGAVILGSPDLADYNSDDAYEQNWASAKEIWSGAHLVLSVESRNVSITGEGTIDGNGKSFFGPNRPEVDGRQWKLSVRDNRPGQMICFVECSNIKIEGISINNSPQWAVFLHGCSNGNLTGLDIYTPRELPTTDGLHITSCRNITVSDCRVDTGDDAITLTAHSSPLKQKNMPCENIVVNNCVFSSDTFGIRILSWGAVRDCIISDCIFPKCRNGIQIVSSYSGRIPLPPDSVIERFYFDNLRLDTQNTPIIISPGALNHKAPIKNIHFSNMHIATGGGFIIRGWETGSTSDIHFRDTDIEFKDTGWDLIPTEEITHNISSNYRHIDGKTVFCTLPYGFYLFNPADISFRNVRLKWAGTEKNKVIPFYAERVRDMRLDNLDIRYPLLKEDDALFQLRDYENLQIDDCRFNGHPLHKDNILPKDVLLDITGKDFFRT